MSNTCSCLATFTSTADACAWHVVLLDPFCHYHGESVEHPS